MVSSARDAKAGDRIRTDDIHVGNDRDDAPQVLDSQGVTDPPDLISTKYAPNSGLNMAQTDLSRLRALWPRLSPAHQRVLLDVAQALSQHVDGPRTSGANEHAT